MVVISEHHVVHYFDRCETLSGNVYVTYLLYCAVWA